MWDKIVHIPFLAKWRVQMPRKGFHDWLSDFCSKQVALIWCLMSLYRYTGITALTTSGLYSQISGFSDIIWIHFILRTSATCSVHLFLLSCNPWNLLISFDDVIRWCALKTIGKPSFLLPSIGLAMTAPMPTVHTLAPSKLQQRLGNDAIRHVTSNDVTCFWQQLRISDNKFQKLSAKMWRDWHKRKKNHRIIENPTKGNVRYWFG